MVLYTWSRLQHIHLGIAPARGAVAAAVAPVGVCAGEDAVWPMCRAQAVPNGQRAMRNVPTTSLLALPIRPRKNEL